MRPRPKRVSPTAVDFAPWLERVEDDADITDNPDSAHRSSAFLSVGTVAADVSAGPFLRLFGLVLRSFYPDPRIPASPKNS